MVDRIRELVEAHAGLPAGVGAIAEDTDLYRAGMKSFASVQLMLALEETFEVEFPEDMLNRATFRSLGAIREAIGKLVPGAVLA